MNNMTEKLIKDGSTNKRVRMNLIGIIIGGALLALGFISLVSGTFVPPSWETYWSIAFSAFMLCGVITFLAIGVKNTIELFRDRDQVGVKYKKLLCIGGFLMLAGIIALSITLLTGWFSGLWGLGMIIAGIVMIFVSAIRSKQ